MDNRVLGRLPKNGAPGASRRQSPQCAFLARKLRRSHRQKSWPQAALECGVLKDDGSPNPGLAFQIAVNGYEPRTDPVRVRCGLKPLHKSVTVNQLLRLPISEQPPEILALALENREEMQ